jgi:rRNA processing protein Gar1
VLDKTSRYALLLIYGVDALVKEQRKTMPETREQIAAKSSHLIQVVDDIFGD